MSRRPSLLAASLLLATGCGTPAEQAGGALARVEQPGYPTTSPQAPAPEPSGGYGLSPAERRRYSTRLLVPFLRRDLRARVSIAEFGRTESFCFRTLRRWKIVCGVRLAYRLSGWRCARERGSLFLNPSLDELSIDQTRGGLTRVNYRCYVGPDGKPLVNTEYDEDE